VSEAEYAALIALVVGGGLGLAVGYLLGVVSGRTGRESAEGDE
jgi:hypothetical protein